ncbi:MAG TPA: hypothetical protein PLA71_03895 [Saccharofermentans sp.]|nr:hypothetical protein [Saccharofermentans sp.]
MNNSAFDSWYNGMVGFHINSERILDDFGMHGDDAHLVRKWMAVCWNNAIDAALNEAQDYQWETQPEVCRKMCEKTLKEKS